MTALDTDSISPADFYAAGLTRRQYEHWIIRGWLRPAALFADQRTAAHPGGGFPRQWTVGELRIARLMARLVDAGLTPRLAHSVARDGVRTLAPGVTLTVEDVW